jgi:penicillin amidase
MKKVSIDFLFPLTALAILIFGLSTQMFNIPPLGKLLDPFMGAVQNEEDKSSAPSQLIINTTGLSDSVHVFFDDREVPHIYAANTEDLYFSQGYVTAYLRLWQMDFLSYVSAGRLSEIFNKESFLDYDRKQRRIGILDAAKNSLELMKKDPETSKIVSAYTRGVNAYIKQLNYKTMPLEYKLLDYEPEPWTDLKTVLILKHMANTLSGYEEDLSMSNMILALGEEDFNKFFPDFQSHSSPVMNNALPGLNNSIAYLKKPEYLNPSFLSSNPVIGKSSYNPKLGSNNWAVSGKKTKSGFPILCNDPHLNLSFPCVWLEMQLSSPGMNVYGVSIPGTPAVIIGFNENIAWGVTNGATDVKDWYKLKITDDYKKYEFDGKWLDLHYKIEEIKRKGQKSLYDTVYSTIHGPIVYAPVPKTPVNNKEGSSSRPTPVNYALRWELHNPSNEFLTFIKLNRARNYEDYKEALMHYSCPIQNFVFACKDNNIAITHQGKMAIKWKGQGKFILDGTKRSHLYTKYIPNDSLPHLLNPECNYVFSANQRPTYSNYSYYYNGRYWETRANRIQKLLEKENEFDIKKMQTMQLDNTSTFAVDALPVLMKSISKNKLTKNQINTLSILNSWTGEYNFDDKNAELFQLWWKNIKDYTWDELRLYSFYSKDPEDYVLLDLIQKEPANSYFDKQGTSMKENADDIIREAFIVALNDYDKMKREKSIKWSDCNKVNIMHMANLPAFSKMNLPSAGYPDAINAMSSNWGPSWRMIVELGDRPRAYGIYPGGQSGNVGSPHYDDFVNDWNKGNYYPLQFFMSLSEAKEHATNTWVLK